MLPLCSSVLWLAISLTLMTGAATGREIHVAHAAANWAPPVIELQTGAVGTRMGKHWIIQNCSVTHARCVGIILGHAPGVDYTDIDAFGDHIVRDNHIRHCGQAGIDLKREDSRAGVLIRYTLPDSVSQLRCPVVDAGLVGVFQRVRQSIEDRDARPLNRSVAADVSRR